MPPGQEDPEPSDPEGSEDDDDDNEDAEFRPSDTLNGTVHWHRRPINDIVAMLHTPWLDLNPSYQRDVVWTSDKMTKLINSLLCGYYVPPIIFNVFKKTLPDGSERYMRVSIDGKQRLTSIREFVAGKIPCTDHKNRSWYFRHTDNVELQRGGKKRRILPQKQKTAFLNMPILCAEYSGLEYRQEEDLFSRVQMGMPLTPAEKLKASSGVWQDFAIELEKKYQTMIENIVDSRRGRGFHLVVQVLKQILNAGEDPPTYSAGATALKGFCDKPSLLDDKVKKAAYDVFDRYNETFVGYPRSFANNNYQHAKKFSPIEFVGVAVLIHRYPDRNATLLHADILDLRSWLREERQDLRSNIATWRAIIAFIDNLEQHRGGVGVLPPRSQGNVNHEFASAEDGEIDLGNNSGPGDETATGRRDLSTQDATGRTHISPASRQIRTPRGAPSAAIQVPAAALPLLRASGRATRAAIVVPQKPSTPRRASVAAPLTSPTQQLQRELGARSAAPADAQVPPPPPYYTSGGPSPKSSHSTQPTAQQSSSGRPVPDLTKLPQSDVGSRFRAVRTSRIGAEQNGSMTRKRGREGADEGDVAIKKERIGPFTVD